MNYVAKRGNLSQFSNVFSQPRQQCFGMAVAAVIYGATAPGIDFDNFDVDGLLTSGDAYYRFCLRKMQGTTVVYEQLCSDNLLSPIDILGSAFDVEKCDLADEITKSYEDGTLQTEALIALREAFADGDGGGYTFTTQGMTVGVWKWDGEYFLFDSHSVDASHRLVDYHSGAAYLYKTTSIEQLGAIMCRIYSSINVGPNWLQMVRIFGIIRRPNTTILMSFAESRMRQRPYPGAAFSSLIPPVLISLSAQSVSITALPLVENPRTMPKKKSAATKAKEKAKKRLSETLEQTAERLEKIKVRKSLRMHAETEEEKEGRLNPPVMAAQSENTTALPQPENPRKIPKKKSTATKNKELATKRLAETLEQTTERLRKDKVGKLFRKNVETEKEKEGCLNPPVPGNSAASSQPEEPKTIQKKKSVPIKAKEKATKRLAETLEQTAERIKKDKVRRSCRKNVETEKETEERLNKDNGRKSSRIITEKEKIKERLNNKSRKLSRMSTETKEEKEKRLITDKLRKTSRRDMETEKERGDRLFKMKTHTASARTIEHISEIDQQYDNVPKPDVTLFDSFQRGIDWNICLECLERFPGLEVKSGVCNRCLKYRGKVNPFSAANNMDPGEVSPILKDLSMVEEQLIAKVHPVISVYRIRGQQFGYSGQVINFPQQVSDIAKKLPRAVSTLSSVLIVRREKSSGYVDFRVRRDKVRSALEYLKEKNRYYRDIEIDDSALNDIPVDGSLLDLIPLAFTGLADDQVGTNESCEVVTSDVPNFIINEKKGQITSVLNNDPRVVAWLKLGTEPINEFSTAGYIAMAFPALFPNGTADLREPRLVRLNPSDYFQHLIKYKDGRFAKHPRFRFFAMNSSLRWAALQNGKVCVQKNSEIQNLTAASIKERLAKNPMLLKKMLCFNSSLRGTSAYWHARCGELLDMVQQLGPPTLFFTLSAADIHWPDICRLLDPGTDYSKLSKSEASQRRNSMLNDNPVIVAWFFANRADFFIKSVVVPNFNVRDFWYRTEFQHRGSPHIHGVLWLNGAPDVQTLDIMDEAEKQSVCQFFDALICTDSPGTGPLPPVHPCQVNYSDISDHEEDYLNLINCVQIHTKHGPQCLRVNKKSKNKECRFKFPFPLEERTHLSKSSGHWELITKRNHNLVNRHNRYITEHWRANTDVQAIVSYNAVLNYIAKYASKAEPRSKTLEVLLGEALQNDEDAVKTVVQKFFVRMVAERDFSAQETAQILMGWPLYHCTRAFVTINVDKKQWVPMENTDGQTTSHKSPFDTYHLRAKEQETMSLFEHASKYYKKGENWIKRRTPCIVRVFPKLRKDQGEAYFRQQVIIHVPWRSVEVLSSQGTWEHLYNLLLEKSDEVLVLPQVEEEYEDVQEDDEVYDAADEWMVAAGMGPNNESGVEVEIGMREIDKNHSWGDAFDKFNDPMNLPRFITLEKSKNCIEDEIWEDPNVTFSSEQMKVLLYLSERISCIKSNCYEPGMMIIQGKAGSGKSTVIKAMCAKLNRELGPNSFRLMAPTGAAAVNVGGSTIHSALHLGIERQFRKMGDENLHQFQENMQNCHFIIIDEMSMVGCTLLKKIDLRCREAKPLFSHLPFANITLFLLGDMKQLPPVLDRPVYGTGFTSMLADQGQLLYKEITACVILSTSYRQGGADQAHFRGILDRLSIGNSTKSDWETLMSREKSRLCDIERRLFSDAMRLYPENRNVSLYNVAKLKDLHMPTAKVSADHNNKEAARASADQQAQGLEKILYLCVGSRVMLKTNLWVKKGLVNGSVGTVTDLVYAPNRAPPSDRPLVVMVKFDNYTGPNIMGSVPIAAVTRSWRTKELTCSRTQFPLILAWAVTIHKSQGLTLPRVVVDLGSRELAVGCSYVALSRAQKLTDVILEPFNFDRLTKIRTMKLLLLRTEEEKRLKRLADRTN